MTLDEEMALAVLKGEKGTALILAQKLIEEHVGGKVELPPIKTMEILAGRKKAVIIFDGDVQEKYPDMDFGEMAMMASRWLRGEENADVLLLACARSVHIYVEPEPPPPLISMTVKESQDALAKLLRETEWTKP